MKLRSLFMIVAPFLIAAFVVSLGSIAWITQAKLGLHSAQLVQTFGVKVNGKPLTLELATTTEAMTEGLGDRDQMPKDHGMLFIFPDIALHSFWMRHMRFPLDIIWLKNGTVVEVAKNLPPPKYVFDIPVTYDPSEPADRVLEVDAGMADRYGLVKGATIDSLAQVW